MRYIIIILVLILGFTGIAHTQEIVEPLDQVSDSTISTPDTVIVERTVTDTVYVERHTIVVHQDTVTARAVENIYNTSAAIAIMCLAATIFLLLI